MEATNMKALSLVSTGVLVLLLGAVAPTYAQEEKHEESAKPAAKQEEAKPAAKQEQTKPAAKQEEAKPAAKQEQTKSAAKQEEAKPAAKQEEAKSAAKQEEAKPAAKQEQTKSAAKQEEAKQEQTKPEAKQQQAADAQQSQGQYAKNGQKDSGGHEYSTSKFGPNHHARFEENGGRYYDGRREYSYGGYWFYAGTYPAWFYQQDVYFIMGADGLWYAVAYGNPSLTFQVNIG
jgi:outer membrane biosynthesis protein TonB